MKAIALAALAGAACLGTSQAWAGGGGGHHEGIDWKELGFAFFNFAVFLGGLVFLLRKPLREFLTARRNTLKDSLDEASRLRAEAEARIRELEAKLANLDAEREQILAYYRQEGELEKARLTEAARRNAEALWREQKLLLDQEARELRRELRRRAVDAAMTLAERTVREELSAQDQQRLADEYIENLKRAAPPVH
jgi:F-type H+-transporting ATPase subunit b